MPPHHPHLLRAVPILLLCLAGGAVIGDAAADTVHVAVAANFRSTQERLARGFEAKTGHSLVASSGSTGKLYAQIVNGAPFELFLAADEERPAQLVEHGFAVRGTAFTYALGSLVLYSAKGIDLIDGPTALREGRFQRLAIANPEAAPYGRAAIETIRHFGLAEALSSKIVRGENVAQAFQFVSSGSADFAFVPASMVRDVGSKRVWPVPFELYSPIRQNGVLLEVGAQKSAARDYLRFLAGNEGRTLIAEEGYGLPGAEEGP
ncbi:MAG: molybdate ABC transporter substrate-binding protein [Gemmatimonadetes bacterium]|nr:molybdate ABC transporter substrate-binding protein [Gemmatimonadota bacterium]